MSRLLIIVASLALGIFLPIGREPSFAQTGASSGLTPKTAARVIGSKLELHGSLDEDVRTVVYAVDGVRTGFGRPDWDHSILVAPGSHLIQIIAHQGIVRDQAAVRVTLSAGKTYLGRIGPGPRPATVALWLQDAETGVSAGDTLVIRDGMMSVENGVLASVPLQH